MKKSLIIFDFDGVLADSFDTFYPLTRDNMKHIGLSLTLDQYRNLFMGNAHQGFKEFIRDDKKYHMFMEFRNSNYDKYYYDEHFKVRLFPEASNFLKKLSKDYILTLASSGQKDNIVSLLKQNNIKNLFSLIIANSSNSKVGMIKDILDKFTNVPEETFFITDTVGDIKVAKKSGLKTIAVTWGFHSKKMLKSANPDFMAKSFVDLALFFGYIR